MNKTELDAQMQRLKDKHGIKEQEPYKHLPVGALLYNDMGTYRLVKVLRPYDFLEPSLFERVTGEPVPQWESTDLNACDDFVSSLRLVDDSPDPRFKKGDPMFPPLPKGDP